MYVCVCNGVTDRAIREAAAQGARDLADLAFMTGCSTSCGTCGELAAQLLREARAARALPLNVYAAAA